MLWAALAAALLLLLLLFRSCGDRDEQVATAVPPVAAPPIDGVAAVGVAPAAGDMFGQLEQYLASGEAVGRRFTFDTLHFGTASAQLQPQAQASLNGLAQILARHPGARVEIVGYADARGSEGANAQLGAQRAQAVVQALTGMGVAANRVTAASGSETNPVAPNTDPQGLAANRRTELVVTAK